MPTATGKQAANGESGWPNVPLEARGRGSDGDVVEPIFRGTRTGARPADVEAGDDVPGRWRANVGLFAIPAAKKVEHGEVFAFEPTSWTFERLKNNASLNGRECLLDPLRIGDVPGEANLQVNVHGKDELNTIGRPAHEQSEVIGTERVEAMTLTRIFGAQGVATWTSSRSIPKARS